MSDAEPCNKTDCRFNKEGKTCSTNPEISVGNACKTFEFSYSYGLKIQRGEDLK